jgi:hypothetical protein
MIGAWDALVTSTSVTVLIEGGGAMSRAVTPLSVEEGIHLGLHAADRYMSEQDKIWSRYSSDKVNIAGALARVLRTLAKALPLEQPLTALSIGSSNEPQFRILESAFRGGLYLLDIDTEALRQVEERIQRQGTPHVRTIHGNYRELLRDAESVCHFREHNLGGQRLRLITLHHSLYYCPTAFWRDLLVNLYEHLLAPEPEPGPSAAIHAVLMASRSDDQTSTTWLYNHFVARFFGRQNDQDLRGCAEQLRDEPTLANAQVLSKSSRVEFFVHDFERFMAVVWMILLHPSVHRFNEAQQREVIEWVYTNLWSRGLPLVQVQDHLVIYRGTGISGLI